MQFLQQRLKTYGLIHGKIQRLVRKGPGQAWRKMQSVSENLQHRQKEWERQFYQVTLVSSPKALFNLLLLQIAAFTKSSLKMTQKVLENG